MMTAPQTAHNLTETPLGDDHALVPRELFAATLKV